jgi:vancomycin permeability regulator SanA
MQWLAVAISLIGLWLVTGGVAEINTGDLITLSAALTYALHVILTDRYIQQEVNHLQIIFQQFLVVGAASLLIALVFGQSLDVPSLKSGGVIVFLALFPTLSAYLIQIKAQTITTPIRVALIFALEPVFAGVFAWTFGGEEFSLLKALGGLLIFTAMVLGTVERPASKQEDPTATPEKKTRTWMQKLLRGGLILTFLLILPRIITTLTTIPHAYSLDEVPEMKIVVVLAAETEHGRPSAVLRDRIQRGVDLYQAGKVEKIVMSGRDPEPEIMLDYAVSLGVPAEDILHDDGGVRTYATCHNAATQLDLDEAIFVTQPFHLPRTLFLCRAMGIDAAGVAAHHGRYWRGSWVAWNIRETLATILAFSDLYVSPPDVNEYTTLYQEGVSYDRP